MDIFLNPPEVAALSLLKGLELQTNNKIGPKHLFGAVGYPRKWNIKTYKDYKKVIELADELIKEKCH